MARRANKLSAYAKQEESATRLLVKMESTGMSIKQLLVKGLTTNRQVAALRACEARFELQKRNEVAEAAKDDKAVTEGG